MTGRWPANVILSPGMADVLDGQSGISPPKAERTGRKGGSNPNPMSWDEKHAEQIGTWPEDPGGGASRFFLNAGYEPWELEWIYNSGLRPCGSEEQ